jgi:hypothetical protein
MERNTESTVIKDAKLLFRNFSGREMPYNSEGDRNFHVILDPETAAELKARNWRVKQLNSREEGEEGDYHLKVNVNYKKGRPPRVVLVTSRGRTDLGADEVGIIDAADVEKADVILNGWWNDMAGGGYSAYLKTIFVTLREDELELMYADLPNAGVPQTTPDNEWSDAG